MEIQDKARPEVDLFLPEAAEQMESYKKKHGRYAKSWNELNFDFSGKPYHVSDPGIYPPKDAGDRWKPKACEYTYVIKSASNDQFLIHAVNDRGVAVYEIRQGMESPVPIGAK